MDARTFTFSLNRLQALRDKARRVGAECPANAQGWVPNDADPTDVVRIFRPLGVQQGYTLRASQYVSGEDSHGIVYAVPAATDSADRKFTRYIEGNGTPRSYLLASILTRELLEFGARRHGCWWSLEPLIGEPPPGEWTWIEPPPEDWSPSVRVEGKTVAVTFWTHALLDPQRITRYTDTYERGQYSFVTDGTVIACQPTTSGGSTHRRWS